MLRLAIVAAVITLAGDARADASTSTPPDAGAAPYAPSAPLPEGFVAVPRADCDGRPGYLDDNYQPPRCLPLPAGFVGEWHRKSSMRAAAAIVRVTLDDEAAGPRPPLRRWVSVAWLTLHGSPRELARALRAGTLRTWTTPAGDYAAEQAQSSSCRECDAIWRLGRVQSDGARRLRVEATVYGHPGVDEGAELRRAFIDGPLGPPR